MVVKMVAFVCISYCCTDLYTHVENWWYIKPDITTRKTGNIWVTTDTWNLWLAKPTIAKGLLFIRLTILVVLITTL